MRARGAHHLPAGAGVAPSPSLAALAPPLRLPPGRRLPRPAPRGRPRGFLIVDRHGALKGLAVRAQGRGQGLYRVPTRVPQALLETGNGELVQPSLLREGRLREPGRL